MQLFRTTSAPGATGVHHLQTPQEESKEQTQGAAYSCDNTQDQRRACIYAERNLKGLPEKSCGLASGQEQGRGQLEAG